MRLLRMHFSSTDSIIATTLAGGCAAVLLLMATSASALIPPNEEAFTLNASVGPVAYTGGSVSLDPIPDSELLDGTNLGIDCLEGVCDIQNQDWVVFRVSVLSGNVSEVGLSLLDSFSSGLNAEGIGYFLEGGPIQDGMGSSASYSGNISTDLDLPTFIFLANGGGGITTGSGFGGSTLSDTSLALFVAYADGSLPQVPSQFPGGDGRVSFMVEPFGGGGAGSLQGNFATPLEVVPEPGTALLMGLGLAMLAVRSNRSRC